jgi:hypothetical protein
MLMRRFLILLVALPAHAQPGTGGSQLWHPGLEGLGAPVQALSHFGQELAIGDFDGDGFGDLVVGQPGSSVGGDSTAGDVVVLYGGLSGPSAAGHQVWTQDAFGNDPAEPDDFFGWTLATGDFDDDGFDDLAIGVPLEDVGSFESAGIVQVLYGTPAGLAALNAQTWSQDLASVPDVAEPEDSFGFALAAGDFDGDGFDDLAIGVPGETLTGSPSYSHLGGVLLLRGAPGGLEAVAPPFLLPTDTEAIPPESELAFGAALAVCDFDSKSPPALAVGLPGFTVGGDADAGGVAVLGFAGGDLTVLFALSQDSADVPGAAEPGDRFGQVLACGDFDRDGADELAVAAPFEAIEADAGAGAVIVIEGGLDPVHSLWYEDLLTGSSSGPWEQFGSALSAADFDGDGAVDLAVGAPGETVGGLAGAGAVFVLRGNAGNGLEEPGHLVITETLDPPEAGDLFGNALAAGRLAGHGNADLAIGVPHEELQGRAELGAVVVLLAGPLFSDGFESGNVSAWSSSVP